MATVARTYSKIDSGNKDRASGWPFAGTLAMPQRGMAALDARPRSPAFGGNRARSSSRRPAQDQPDAPEYNFRTTSNQNRLMNPAQRSLNKAHLYLVLDTAVQPYHKLWEILKQSVNAGIDIIQLRDKQGSVTEILRFAKKAKAFINSRCIFIINDRLDIALACGADGAHLGQEDLPVKGVRKIPAGRRVFIGRSTHSLEQALAAAKEGPDYIGVGPIFETPTKPTYQPVGTDLIRQAARHVRIPFVCIGGINQDNLQQVLDAGARRVAVVRAIFEAEDVEQATKDIKKIIDGHFVNKKRGQVFVKPD